MEKKQLSRAQIVSYSKARACLGQDWSVVMNEIFKIAPHLGTNELTTINWEIAEWWGDVFLPNGGPIRKRILKSFNKNETIPETKNNSIPGDIKFQEPLPIKHDEL
jgi:hypothetical protein